MEAVLLIKDGDARQPGESEADPRIDGIKPSNRESATTIDVANPLSMPHSRARGIALDDGANVARHA
jgi:hypothetical protein